MWKTNIQIGENSDQSHPDLDSLSVMILFNFYGIYVLRVMKLLIDENFLIMHYSFTLNKSKLVLNGMVYDSR